MQGVFYGVGASVIAIIARSAWKLATKTLGSKRLSWLIFGVTAALTVWTESEIVWLFLGAGVWARIVHAAARPANIAISALSLFPRWFVSGLMGPAPESTLSRLFWYFAEAGAFVFGSGLAIVPFLHGGVVNQFHWLTERQFLDAVAVAMITPGTIVITVSFIGYLVAGPAGGLAAALGVFLPCYLFVIIPAPYFKRFASNAWIAAFVEGVTAAATGAIAGAAIVLGRRAITDVTTALIAAMSFLLLWKVRKLPEPALIALTGIAADPFAYDSSLIRYSSKPKISGSNWECYETLDFNNGLAVHGSVGAVRCDQHILRRVTKLVDEIASAHR